MIYQLQQIKSTLSNSSALSTAAGVSMTTRVFIKIGEVDMFAQVNLGRLPEIYLRQISGNYEFQAEPNHNGTRTMDIQMRILVPTFINRSESQYLLLERIKMAALSVLTKDLNLGMENIRVEAPQVTQMATIMDVTFTTNISYDENYEEEI
jgi:hypothetical protein